MKEPKFFVGLLFDTKMMFKRVVESYSMKWGTEHGWEKNDKNRVRENARTKNATSLLMLQKNQIVMQLCQNDGPEH